MLSAILTGISLKNLFDILNLSMILMVSFYNELVSFEKINQNLEFLFYLTNNIKFF